MASFGFCERHAVGHGRTSGGLRPDHILKVHQKHGENVGASRDRDSSDYACWPVNGAGGPNYLGRRARSVPQQTTHPNLATLPDILALLLGIIPQAFAGGLHRTQVTSALPAGTAPPQTQPGRTNPRWSPRTKSETGHSLRNLLPPGLPRSQSTGTSLICDKDHASRGAQGNGRLPRTCPMTRGDKERSLEDAASRWRVVMPLRRPCLEDILWKSSLEDPSVSTKAHTSQGRCPHSR